MTDRVLYLSEGWLVAADAALARLRIEPAPRWSVCYRVRGGPSGTTTHRLVFDEQRVSAQPGSGDASVTLTLDWDLAVAVNQGAESAQGAFLDGRIQLSGDPGVLLGHRDELTAADDELQRLRQRTVYSLAAMA